MADQSAAPAARGAGRKATVGRTPLALSDLVFYNPNRPDATEAIWQPFYDFQPYVTAGQSSLTFFQVPNGGQLGGAARTYADTNMELAGQFPAPTAFLCTAIMVVFEPSQVPSVTSTALAVDTVWNDVVAVANSGYMEMKIGSKVYLRDAPIGKFPPNFTVGGVAAVGVSITTGTSTAQTKTSFARAPGRYCEVTPFLIPQSQNFNVTLYWPTLQAVSATGRIGVVLDGFYYRQSQ